jgi:hypothetical protein
MSDSNPRQFSIHGVITDWDPDTRQLFIAGTRARSTAMSVSVGGGRRWNCGRAVGLTRV